ncbi:hypothetical protein HPB51_000559 [Rhipicephalus microplus]|uniref:Uncharacterized protein n=1 Tax=Rhipicephalus microplus TaxID=6941 RepID=A0A9J6DYK8_RHIMP|nr:hypothetical protein HPB51_000559 [Rhipicephalus microplus]
MRRLSYFPQDPHEPEPIRWYDGPDIPCTAGYPVRGEPPSQGHRTATGFGHAVSTPHPDRCRSLLSPLMSVAGTSRLEVSCVLHWFSLWNSAQREAFSATLLAHLAPPKEDPASELCGQLDTLSLSRRNCPSVLRCQLSLCELYFASWGPEGQREFLHTLAQRDGPFVARFLGSLAQREPLLAQALAP